MSRVLNQTLYSSSLKLRSDKNELNQKLIASDLEPFKKFEFRSTIFRIEAPHQRIADQFRTGYQETPRRCDVRLANLFGDYLARCEATRRGGA